MEPAELRSSLAGVGVELFCTVPSYNDLEAEHRYLRWLERGIHGSMAFLARHASVKYRPSSLLEECTSLLFIAVPYPSREGEERPSSSAAYGRVADYAAGRDYHKTLKKILRQIEARLSGRFPRGKFRSFVDSGPLDERYYATGRLGFIGRNRLLISRVYGSRFFIGEVLSSEELPRIPVEDEPAPRTENPAAVPGALCPPDCRACIDACPSGALTEGGDYIPERCISYLTIEYEGEIEAELRRAMGDRLFGCDTCQNVCPYNRAAAGGSGGDVPADFSNTIAGKWVLLDEVMALRGRDEMVERFGGSPLMRCSVQQLKRNAEIVRENVKRDIGEGAFD